MKVFERERVGHLRFDRVNTAPLLHRVKEVVGDEDAGVGALFRPEEKTRSVVGCQCKRPFSRRRECDKTRKHGANVSDARAACECARAARGAEKCYVWNSCAGAGKMVEQWNLRANAGNQRENMTRLSESLVVKEDGNRGHTANDNIVDHNTF